MPQGVPGARLPESTQVWVPVTHEVTPALQPGLGLLLQGRPLVHETQLPVGLQMRSGPHEVPAGAMVPSTQVRVVQLAVPARHGAPGLVPHGAPATHAPQNPEPSHTSPGQAVPASLGWPSTQVGSPVRHEVEP